MNNSVITSDRFAKIGAKADIVIDRLVAKLVDGYTLISAVSHGKDSSCVLVLMLEAMKRAKIKGIEFPRCYVSHGDTGMESPAVHFYAMSMNAALETYAAANQLPLQLVISKPSLTSTFAYSTIGRGKLPIYASSSSRDCSVDWKIRPQEKAMKALLEGNPKSITLVGTRFAESTSRKSRMEERGEGAEVFNPNSYGGLVNAPIADWELNDVWQLLCACDANRGGIYQTFIDNFDWCLEVYRDSNGGTCSILLGERGGNKAACGSRWGCAICCVAGDSDKSMEAFIASDEKYHYLKGINQFRDYLVKIRFDMDKRDWLGRGVSKAGYINVIPDNLSSRTKRDLLRFLLTLDVEEEERAEEWEAKIFNGEVPDTLENQRLASTQFQFITPQLLLGVDLMWSLHRDYNHSFPAVREWYEIREQGRRYHVPTDYEAAPRCSIPAKRWFKLTNHDGSEGLDHPWGIDGLRDYYGEAVNPKRKPHSVPYMQIKDTKTGEPRRVVAFNQSSELEIDAVEANMFVSLEYEDLYFDSLNLDSAESAKFLFDRGLVSTSAGHMAVLDHMARRGQFWDRLKEALNVMSVQAFAIDQSISDSDHDQILAELPVDIENQIDMFGFEPIAPSPTKGKPLLVEAA